MAAPSVPPTSSVSPSSAPAGPSRPIPSMRQKRNGAYFVRIGKRDYYLGMDRAAAAAKYADLIATVWQPDQVRRAQAAAARAAGAGAAARRLTVAELVALFLDHVSATVDTRPNRMIRGAAREYYTKHLSRFLHAWGRERVLELATPRPDRGFFQPPLVAVLEALKADMLLQQYSPTTVRHDLNAVRRLFAWAGETGRCPPVSLRAVSNPQRPPRLPQPVPVSVIKEAMRRARQSDPGPNGKGPILEAAIALSYLALLRPTELVRLAHGGDDRACFVEPGVFAMWSKSTGKTGVYRHVVLSDEALEWLAALWGVPCPPYAPPAAVAKLKRAGGKGREADAGLWPRPAPPNRRPFPWSRPDGYSSALALATQWGPRRQGALAPSVLRDSGATHLRAAGVDLADVQLLLGHTPPGEWQSYARTAWSGLRAKAALLTLR